MANENATVVVQYQVRPGHLDDYLEASARLERRSLRTSSGFEGASFHVDALGKAHTSVYGFGSVSDATSFRDGVAFRQHCEDVREFLEEPPFHQVVVRPQQPGVAVASAVVSAQVLPGSESWYAEWQGRVQAVEQTFPGYVGQRLQAPIPGTNPEWITLVAFDSPANLEAWMSSHERRELLREAEPHVRTSDVRPAQSAFESWFRDDSGLLSPPPAWKLSAIVLLVLYPVVMLEILTLNKVTSGLGVALSTFVGNVVSVGLTGFLLIPWASRLLRWWLVPPVNLTMRRTVSGIVVVALLYAVSIVVFWFISHIILGMP